MESLNLSSRLLANQETGEGGSGCRNGGRLAQWKEKEGGNSSKSANEKFRELTLR